jgi:multidrug transporter EmrE-like cation transporter
MRTGAWNRLLAGKTVKNTGLIVTAAVFVGFSQLCIRKGMLQIGRISFASSSFERLPAMFANIYLWLGLLGYFSSLVLWLITLSKTDVGFAYLIQSALSFVIVTVMAHFIFGENIPPLRIAGLVVICFGLFIVAKAG